MIQKYIRIKILKEDLILLEDALKISKSFNETISIKKNIKRIKKQISSLEKDLLW